MRFLILLIFILVGCEFSPETIPEGDEPPVNQVPSEVSEPEADAMGEVQRGEVLGQGESSQDSQPPEPIIQPEHLDGGVDCPPEDSPFSSWEEKLCNFVEKRKGGSK